MKRFTLSFVAFLMSAAVSYSQGCIAVRNISGFGQYNLTDNAFTTSKWQLDLTNRYFRSFRDFKEKTDLKTPVQNESVNEVYTFDMLLGRRLGNGWSIILNIPITDNARTSSFEHGGANTARHTTRSFGAGDLRFTARKWLLPSSAPQKWNVQVGLGIKFPTGDYKYQDYFYRNDTTRVLAAVNPSIQLGDGGTGIITELNTFYKISNTLSLFGDFYYLVSPRNQNGTLYTMGKTLTALQVSTDGVNNSVPDVFALRAGAFLSFNKVSFSAAIRHEGSPVYDLLGASDGARRAGYYLSVEPGILYRIKSVTCYAYLPFVADRKIAQNVPDKKASTITGSKVVGPGGSANMVFFAGVSLKF